MTSRVFVVCAIAAFSVACGDDRDGGTADGGVDDASLPLDPLGRYAVSTRAQLTVAAVAPGTAGDAFAGLRALRSDPAAALIAAVGGARVPSLPAALSDRLNGWINESLLGTTVGGVSLVQRIDFIIAIGDSVLTDFGLDTTLTLAAPEGSSASHALDAVRFFLPPPAANIVIPRIDPPAVATPPPATLTTHLQVKGPHSRALTLGKHGFSFPYGQYAWLGFNKALHQASGADLAALMATAIDCTAMATAVAARCVGPLCVGHATELRGFCEQGRARLVAEVEERFVKNGIDAVEFQSGTAVVGNATDGVTSLSEGIWLMQVNAGGGLRSVAAVFTGRKVGGDRR